MPAVWTIIKKNFKLLIRSKSSALIVILGPLLVIFLVGIAFDNINKYSLSIGVYSDSYSDVTESFIAKMREKEFRVQKIDSMDLCIEKIKQTKLHTCIIFPPDLTIESDAVNEITFYVDYSKLNLVWMILDTLSTKIEERSSELSLDLTTALLQKVESTKEEVAGMQPKIQEIQEQREAMINKINKDIIGVKFKELKADMNEIREYILLKINITEDYVAESLKKLNSADNISNSSKSSISEKLNSINTIMYNLKGMFKDENGSVGNWVYLVELIDGVSSDLSAIQYSLVQENVDIIDIKNSLDRIEQNLESVVVTNATTIVNPVNMQIKPVAPEKTYLGYMFPALVILIVMFISILLSTTLVMMEKHSPAYFRNFITPTRNITFIVSTYLTTVLLVVIQIGIIIGISSFFLKRQIIETLFPSLSILLLSTTFFTFVGMFIGYVFTSEETATLAAISLGSVFLFLSNVILPLESMPAYIGRIAQYNPFVLGEGLLRKAIIFKAGFNLLLQDIYIMASYAGILFVLIVIFHAISGKGYFSKLMNQRKN